MTDNDIIKALEDELKTALTVSHRFMEAWDTVNPDDDRFIALLSNTLKLINRQKAENERLQHIRAELSKENEEQDRAIINALHRMKVVRTEAIKEFAERLRNKFFNYYDGLTENTCKSCHNGDSLMMYEVADMITVCIESAVVEMTEGEDET